MGKHWDYNKQKNAVLSIDFAWNFMQFNGHESTEKIFYGIPYSKCIFVEYVLRVCHFFFNEELKMFSNLSQIPNPNEKEPDILIQNVKFEELPVITTQELYPLPCTRGEIADILKKTG